MSGAKLRSFLPIMVVAFPLCTTTPYSITYYLFFCCSTCWGCSQCRSLFALCIFSGIGTGKAKVNWVCSLSLAARAYQETALQSLFMNATLCIHSQHDKWLIDGITIAAKGDRPTHP